MARSGKTPRVIVCAGGGGVGKTTSSAALATAIARSGKRALVVTIDPARRLADALEVTLGNEVQLVTPDESTGDRLYALMPDPATATRTFMHYLFAERPESLARLLENGLFRMLEDKLVGMNELVAMTLAVQAVDALDIDVLIVDTAPSRYALDFLTYPPRLAALLEGKAVKWLGSLAQRAEAQRAAGDDAPPPQEKSSRFARWGKKRVEAALAKVIGESLINDTTQLFAEVALVRERFAALARRLGDLLLGKQSRHVLVAAPTGAARDDVEYLLGRLAALKQKAAACLLNRSDASLDAWTRLRGRDDLPAVLHRALHQLHEERRAQQAAATEFSDQLASAHPKLQRIRLPLVEASNPAAIVAALADALEPHIDRIV